MLRKYYARKRAQNEHSTRPNKTNTHSNLLVITPPPPPSGGEDSKPHVITNPTVACASVVARTATIP